MMNKNNIQYKGLECNTMGGMLKNKTKNEG